MHNYNFTSTEELRDQLNYKYRSQFERIYIFDIPFNNEYSSVTKAIINETHLPKPTDSNDETKRKTPSVHAVGLLIDIDHDTNLTLAIHT